MKYSIYRMSDLFEIGMYSAVLVTALMLTVSLCNAGELMDKVPNTEASNSP